MDIENVSSKAAVRIRRPPHEVFNAFADAGAMSAFWFTRRDQCLKEGELVTWYLGAGEDAYAFDVHVKRLREPDELVIEWERDGHYTQVSWLFEETKHGETNLTIRETGFAGTREQIIAQVIDSTGGFNQVIIAAKAFIEYDARINVVADHA